MRKALTYMAAPLIYAMSTLSAFAANPADVRTVYDFVDDRGDLHEHRHGSFDPGSRTISLSPLEEIGESNDVPPKLFITAGERDGSNLMHVVEIVNFPDSACYRTVETVVPYFGDGQVIDAFVTGECGGKEVNPRTRLNLDDEETKNFAQSRLDQDIGIAVAAIKQSTE
jgi:hypothetical protein